MLKRKTNSTHVSLVDTRVVKLLNICLFPTSRQNMQCCKLTLRKGATNKTYTIAPTFTNISTVM